MRSICRTAAILGVLFALAAPVYASEEPPPRAGESPIDKAVDATEPRLPIPDSDTNAPKIPWRLGWNLAPSWNWWTSPIEPIPLRPGQKLGWFGAVETNVLKPRFEGRFSPAATVGAALPIADNIPFSPLDWTVMPAVELGYRFREGSREARIAYRTIASDGTSTLPSFAGVEPVALRSRLALNTLDVDYISNELFLLDGPPRELSWGFGVRAASVFFDSRATGPLTGETRASDSLAGAGPRFRIEWIHPLPIPSLALSAHAAGGGIFGQTRQRYSVTPAGGPTSEATTSERTTGTAFLNGNIGLAWTPQCGLCNVRLRVGYLFERWWFLGLPQSNADLIMQGVGIRAEIGY